MLSKSNTELLITVSLLLITILLSFGKKLHAYGLLYFIRAMV